MHECMHAARHAGKSQCMPGIAALAARCRTAAGKQAGKSQCMHDHARPPGACPTASLATLVLPAPSSLSCSRDSRTRRAAFLVVINYWRQCLVATASAEQQLCLALGRRAAAAVAQGPT